MNEKEKGCYRFVRNLAEELSSSYDIQYEKMEEFARWNLAEEIALEWIDTEGMIDILEYGKCISKEAVDILREIINAFIFEFENTDSSVWTHKAMQGEFFWEMQRKKARRVLDIMICIKE